VWKKKIQEKKKRLQTLEDLYKLAQQKFERGLVNYLTVLDAERQILSEKIEIAALRGEKLKRQVLLIKTLGGGFKGF